MLSQQARTGRIIVLTVLILTVVMSAGMITLTNLLRGPDRIVQEAVRFLLTILLCVLVYQGKGWARWVYASLIGLGGLFALVSAVPLAARAPVGALIIAAIGVIYLACAVTLAAVPAASQLIDNAAHAGGLVTGIALGLLLERRASAPIPLPDTAGLAMAGRASAAALLAVGLMTVGLLLATLFVARVS